MAVPVIPLAVGTLAILAWRKARPSHGVMTAERDRVYRAAIGGSLKDPEKLRKLADAFERERLFPQAALLRQRADLRELPPEIRKERNKVFRKAMRSKNKAAVLRLADAYDREGCTSACEKLRAYASGLPDVDGTESHDPVVETQTESAPVETPAETAEATTLQ